MNFSTNQVKQLYVLNSSSVVTQKVIKTPDGAANKAVVLDIDGERTDILDLKLISTITTAKASDASQQLKRKGVLVALNPNVNSGNPVAGQDYIIGLTYRGHIGEEDTYHKFAEAKAKTGDTAATLLQALAASFIAQQNVEVSPLYDLFTAAGDKLVDSKGIPTFSATKAYAKGDKVVYTDGKVYAFTTSHSAGSWTTDVAATGEAVVSAITSTGFYIVEPVPYWALGKFPETLMKMEIATPAIIAASQPEENWLANYKFVAVPASLTAVAPIYNSHKVADLEYFCKGERGVSAGLHAPYDVQIPLNLKVNADAQYGYDILNIHFAFKGDNQQSTLSEKDITIVAPGDGTSTINSKLSTIKSALEALL